jgi:hypothetical protein
MLPIIGENGVMRARKTRAKGRQNVPTVNATWIMTSNCWQVDHGVTTHHSPSLPITAHPAHHFM